MITRILAMLLGAVLALCPLQISPVWAASNAPLPLPQSVVTAQAIPSSSIPHSTSFVAAVVDRVGAAVVRIDTERTITRNADPFSNDPFFRRFFGEGGMSMSPYEERLQGQGSGFIVDKNGTILTNAHVVDQADRVTVNLKDGRRMEGKVLGVDEVTDLAVVKISVSGEDLPIASLGDSEQVRVGDWAIAVGNPLGLDNTVTLGIVSTLNRSSAMVGIPDKRLDFIQTDAAINPGNSGGPLLDEQGEVIGINTAIRANAMGIGFAIPINKAKEIMPKLIQGQQVSHPYLGVQIATLTPDLAKQNNSDPNSTVMLPELNGALVMGVVPNSPAANGGIRRGDVITQIDGQAVTTADQLQGLVDRTQVGQPLRVTIRRGDGSQQLTVRTAELQSVRER
ncbi:MAG: trypsin-like peptidase domain-containing protein [Oscillatoriophycideae cyanobacterium NC_groundwater_1537_Pr4_S-0.65um_50_18]|nr:trypsin-like peptidase domain-containing protein [Oscillatoriophycideae cyanobacterium NC_groundwater_1537_Pr4_S-0.65um_50_18]